MTTPRHGRGHGPRLPRLLRAGPIILLLLDVVDDYFYQILVLCVIMWTPLCKDGVFEFGDVALEDKFICGVQNYVKIPTLSSTGPASNFFLHLVFVAHGDVLSLEAFFLNDVGTNSVL